MILDANSVGELVDRLAARGEKGRVRRVFRSSAYLESRGGLVLLLRGALKSPMTVNVLDGHSFFDELAVDERFEARDGQLRVGDTRIRLSHAERFRSELRRKQKLKMISGTEITRGATALKLLYSTSDAALTFVGGEVFSSFADRVLRPLAAGEYAQARRLPNYSGLLGSGTGFTPAGDDVVAGFTAAFNFYARGTGKRPILLPAEELRRRTVLESAWLVDYAQRGYVDDGLQGLILAGFRGEQLGFREKLHNLASRGHTSGLDMSLGVLMLLACVSEGHALESFLQALVEL